MLLGSTRVDIRAWFTLAVTAPIAMLALGAAATSSGPARMAGLWMTGVLGLMFLLALNSLEKSARGIQDREQTLLAAFYLTTTEACLVLLVALAGAPLTGPCIAVGLTVAALPLGLALVIYGLTPVWASLKLDIPDAPPVLQPIVVKTAAEPRAATWMWALAPDRVAITCLHHPVVMAPQPRAPEDEPSRVVLYAPRLAWARAKPLAA